MIAIAEEKCTGCGLCVRDCPVGVLLFKADDSHPQAAHPEHCLRCQHCLAICPAGAVTVAGVSPEQAPALGPLPEPERLTNLLRQRRSIRHFADREIAPELLRKLMENLPYSPTGCNDHRLMFFWADRQKMIELRDFTNAALKKLSKIPWRWLIPRRYRRFLAAVTPESDLVFRNAPHLLLVAVPKKAPCAADDPVIALAQFELLCQSYGIGCCWCGFGVRAFAHIKALKKMLALPTGYRIGGVMLFGYPQMNYARATVPEPVKISRL